jgi:hypothetical protein
MKTVMKTAAIGAVLVSTCMAGSVQAYESSADFRLDPIVGLSTGGSSAPGDVGQWLTPNAYDGSVTIQYSWADGSRAWNQDTFTSAGLPLAARNGDPFGPLQLAGGAVILVGIALSTAPRTERAEVRTLQTPGYPLGSAPARRHASQHEHGPAPDHERHRRPGRWP